jgi:hypothetical protein
MGAVTDMNPDSLHTILQGVRRSALSREQVFRLWRCAVKDDDDLVDEVIQQVYENIIAFDCERAESVIELIVRRNLAAGCAFRSLLKDMRVRHVGALGEATALLGSPATYRRS